MAWRGCSTAGGRSGACVVVMVVVDGQSGRVLHWGCIRLSWRYIGLLNSSCTFSLGLGVSRSGDRLTLTNDRLKHGNNASQTTLNISIFLLDSLLGAKNTLQFLIGLLVGEFLDTTLESVDLVLSALANGSLSFTILDGVSKGVLGCICLSDVVRRMG